MDDFTGWPPDGPMLLGEIAGDNRAERWDARHEAAVRSPTVALAAALEAEFGPVRVFRPRVNRRFRPSVPPLRTDTGAVAGTPGGCGLAVVLSATALTVSAGHWRFDGGQARRYRAAVAGEAEPRVGVCGPGPAGGVSPDGAEAGRGDRDGQVTGPAAAAGPASADPGKELETILVDLAHGGLVPDPSGRLRTAARGWPGDHPLIGLLSRRGLQVVRSWDAGSWLATPEPLRRVQEAWRAAIPLVTWLDTHVGPPDAVPPRPRREAAAVAP